MFSSKAEGILPVQIGGLNVSLRTDVVECDVPLLFSKEAMKEAKIVGEVRLKHVQIIWRGGHPSFVSVIMSHEMLPQITVPTKINRNSCKLYDHIFTRFKNTNIHVNAGIYETKISDHLPVFISLNTIQAQRANPQYKTIRDTKMEHIQCYLDKVASKISNTEFDKSLNGDSNSTYNNRPSHKKWPE